MDIGRGEALELPREETERRWQLTTREWPIMDAVLHGVSRDQFMARHKANHIQVVYCDGAESADHTLQVKAAMADALAIRVSICGRPLIQTHNGAVTRRKTTEHTSS